MTAHKAQVQGHLYCKLQYKCYRQLGINKQLQKSNNNQMQNCNSKHYDSSKS